MVFVSSTLNYLRQQRDYRATRRILHTMDDHLLRDIGIRRDQIDSLALEQRNIRREQTAAEARNRRNALGSTPGVGGHGLAAQH